MAEVEYKREPTVSVHGVPQSQYNAAPQTYGNGGAGGFFKQHWPWLVGGALVLGVAYYIYVKNSGQSYNAAIDPNTGMPVGATSPDQLWGSQLDADMQQMMSFQNQLIGILQQQQQQGSGSGSGSNPPPNPPPPKLGLPDRVRNTIKTWDSKRKNGSRGVPLDSSAGSGLEAYIPYGANLTVTGPAVHGPKTTHGKGLYYPVSYGGMTGFVNSIDLTSQPTVFPNQ